MDAFTAIGSWISENESRSSGMAAMTVLTGVILSPLGIGLRIAYNERGNGPPDLILAPGIISHLDIGDPLPSTRDSLESLARFARVLTFDKRGQGLSDPTLLVPDLEERARAPGDNMGQGSEPRDLLFPSLSREPVDDDTDRAFERAIATRDAVGGIVAMRIEPDVRPLLPEIRVPCLVARYAGELSHSPEAIDQIQRFCEHVTRAGGRSASRPRRHSGRSPESSG